ncbi:MULTISPECIES: META domain-containing protein [Bizionia]|uniref:META domain-containing protein n=1 Tax=Bizionia algoritergicola TaxID=291187 RepID=A0A5D0R212_9FLAO|nr:MULTISPECIES: META domain-containing protein [Bizionia]TYB74891.1 META domain-containing protein [Bizionia algoritergicola]
MKYISFLFISLFMVSCGTCKNASAMSKQTPLSGNYIISAVGENALIDENLNIMFNLETNMVAGFSGCNQFSGSYSSTDSGLEFGLLASTRKMCRPEANTIEQSVLKALNETSRFSEENGVISFYNEEGTVLITMDKSETSDTEKMSDQKEFQVEYMAISRGYYLTINYENKSISFQKDRTSETQIKSLSETEITSIENKIAALNLETLETLEPPSKAHQYDGAAGATLKITKNGTDYRTPTFDAGKPPKAIEALVSELIAHTEKQ